MAVSKKKAEINEQCAACGCCVKICPLNLISIHKGIYAVVDEQKCIGCGKCVGAWLAGYHHCGKRGRIK